MSSVRRREDFSSSRRDYGCGPTPAPRRAGLTHPRVASHSAGTIPGRLLGCGLRVIARAGASRSPPLFVTTVTACTGRCRIKASCGFCDLGGRTRPPPYGRDHHSRRRCVRHHWPAGPIAGRTLERWPRAFGQDWLSAVALSARSRVSVSSMFRKLHCRALATQGLKPCSSAACLYRSQAASARTIMASRFARRGECDARSVMVAP